MGGGGGHGRGRTDGCIMHRVHTSIINLNNGSMVENLLFKHEGEKNIYTIS